MCTATSFACTTRRFAQRSRTSIEFKGTRRHDQTLRRTRVRRPVFADKLKWPVQEWLYQPISTVYFPGKIPKGRTLPNFRECCGILAGQEGINQSSIP